MVSYWVRKHIWISIRNAQEAQSENIKSAQDRATSLEHGLNRDLKQDHRSGRQRLIKKIDQTEHRRQVYSQTATGYLMGGCMEWENNIVRPATTPLVSDNHRVYKPLAFREEDKRQLHSSRLQLALALRRSSTHMRHSIPQVVCNTAGRERATAPNFQQRTTTHVSKRARKTCSH